MPTPPELPIERLALRHVAAVEEVAERLPSWRRYLATQMRRAALSVYLNLREGVGEFTARDKARFYRMSSRSLRECFGCLRIALMLHPDLAPEVRRARSVGAELNPKIVRLARYQTHRAAPASAASAPRAQRAPRERSERPASAASAPRAQ